jgi:hypothetical protein
MGEYAPRAVITHTRADGEKTVRGIYEGIVRQIVAELHSKGGIRRIVVFSFFFKPTPMPADGKISHPQPQQTTQGDLP